MPDNKPLTKEDVIKSVSHHLLIELISMGVMDLAKKAMDEWAKKQSIAFAKWIDDKGYCRVDENRKWESLSDFSGKTDEELYTLFIEQSK